MNKAEFDALSVNEKSMAWAHMTSAERAEVRDLSELDPRFTLFYESGERVEVTWCDGWEDYSGYGARTDGKRARFYVGRSTGWRPCYIQVLNRRSMGGQSIMSEAVQSIRGLREYRR